MSYDLARARERILLTSKLWLADRARLDVRFFQDWVVSHMGCANQVFASGLGIAGEAGEVADLIKKHYCHGLPLDREKLIKELGDVLHYVASVGALHAISLEQIMSTNVDKIEARYPNGFSTEAAAARADEKASEPDLDAPPTGYDWAAASR